MRFGLDTGFLVAAELAEHPDHAATRARLEELIAGGARLVLAPQVLAEFIHIATDGRRFERPLEIAEAQRLSDQWWTGREVEQVFPNNRAVRQFLDWLREYRLGRKRLLDTLLAATYRAADVDSLLTLNSGDFTVFGGFQCMGPIIRDSKIS